MSLMKPFASFPATTPEAIEKITDVQSKLTAFEQLDVATEHILHAGMYSRTIRLGPGIIITGALVKLATMLIFNGHADVLLGDQWVEVRGYGVICGSSGRKQVFVTRSDLDLTMIFPSRAKTVEEAEAEFTDEADQLLSRRSTRDVVVITGE